MPDRELLVRILGDDRDLQRTLANTERRVSSLDDRTKSFGRNIKTAFAAAGVTVGVSTLVAGADAAVDAYSALNEQIDRTTVVLGDSADEMIDWSQTTASSLGISQRAALESAATFSGLFRTLGAVPAQAGVLSRSLVKLAADLASLQDTSPEEALTALRSGLVGEAEPLRRYNIFLTEANVQQRAMADTGKRVASELTQREKIMARYAIIVDQGSVANDNFSDTSDSLANKQRIAAAEAENLAANFGQLLAPAMDIALTSSIALTGGLNDLITGLGGLRTALRDIEAFDGWNSAVEDANEGISDFFQGIADGIPILSDLRDSIRGSIGGSGDQGIPAIDSALSQAQELLDLVEKADEEFRKRAERAAGRSERKSAKAFSEFIKGMGLKLDRAELTEGTEDDLAVLRELEAAILRRIDREGKTFVLMQQLVRTRQQINAIVQSQAGAAEQAGVDAFDATIDALTLDLDVARATDSLRDDQRALRALEQAILRRISTEGQSTDLMRQLFNVRQEQKDVAQRLRDQQRERRRGRQFEELGLTETGEERAPSARSLRLRGESLEERIKGTALDTTKNRQILDRAAEVLSGKFGKVGRDVRNAIKGMFDEIASALKGGDEQVGPLTKTAGLNTKKILEGLGLSAEEINELRGRLSHINSAGNQAVGIAPAPRRGQFRGVPGLAGIVLESHTTINLDGQQVANVVTRQQQKTNRRNPRQKRGPNRSR